MKKHTQKRILSACIALVMLLLLVPLSSFISNVTEVEAADTPVLDQLSEFKATSSSTIKRVGDMAEALGSKEVSALFKRVGGCAALLGGSIDALRGGINAFNPDDKWYEKIWNIGKGAVAGFLGLGSSSSSEPPVNYDLEEIKSMIKDMDKDFQDIKDQIGNLEQTIQLNFDHLSNTIVNKIQEVEYKQFLNEFTQVNDRDAFSYYSFFKPDLERCYNELKLALESDDEKNIKQAYDNLYLVAKQSEQLYYYISGESTILTSKQSIQDILYEYSMLSGVQDFELTCLTFAEDVNSTFVFAQYCLSLCYGYQLEYAEQNSLPYGAYYYVQQDNTSIESIQISSISSKTTDMLQKQDIVIKKLAKFLSKVLQLDGEYTYTSNSTRFGTIKYSEILAAPEHGTVERLTVGGNKVHYRVNNKLNHGDVIRFGVMPFEYIDMFDHDSFSVEVSNANAIVLTNGSIKVNEYAGSFDVIYKYAGEECFRVPFQIGGLEFRYGLGIEGAPYLITTPQDFEMMRKCAGKCYYLLANDIDFEGKELDKISSTAVFDGVLDGAGYHVYNYSITNVDMAPVGDLQYVFNNALFPILGQSGVIKNLTVGTTQCDTFDGYSVKIAKSISAEFNTCDAYSSAIVGKNLGTVSNCHVQNVILSYVIDSTKLWAKSYTNVGGIVAENAPTGIVAHCSVEYFTFNVDTEAPEECMVYAGGIAGTNHHQGKIVNCFVYYVFGSGECYSVGLFGGGNSAVHSGIMIGKPMSDSVISNLYRDGASDINIIATGIRYQQIGGFRGDVFTGSASESALKTYGWLNDPIRLDKNTIKSISIDSLPYKTTYYLGEELNLAGLSVSFGNSISKEFLGVENTTEAYGYTVSQFDPQKLGVQTITVSYDDLSTSYLYDYLTATFEVTVLCPHDWQQGVETQKPSHIQDGKLTYTCSICGETKDIELNKTPEHDFATYTNFDDQKHQKSCECGAVKLENHSWDQGTETIPATSTQEGEMTYECLLCDATYSESIPKLENVSVIIVGDASAQPGETLQINVRLENNPGVAMLRLKIEFDSTLLTLDEVVYNSAIGGNSVQPVINDGFVVLLWYNENQNVTGDWAFATLNFTVKDDAPMGSVSDVTLTYQADEVCNIEEENVHFDVDNGSASVTAHVAGDINGDGSLTSKDLLRMAKYFAEWDVDVDQSAMDVNGDGVVNSKDLLRLARYLSGWDVEIY